MIVLFVGTVEQLSQILDGTPAYMRRADVKLPLNVCASAWDRTVELTIK